jgi:CubicO group peptidase (beta-lactamase class C family)
MLQTCFSSGNHLAYHAVTAGYILGEIIERVTGQDFVNFC